MHHKHSTRQINSLELYPILTSWFSKFEALVMNFFTPSCWPRTKLCRILGTLTSEIPSNGNQIRTTKKVQQTKPYLCREDREERKQFSMQYYIVLCFSERKMLTTGLDLECLFLRFGSLHFHEAYGSFLSHSHIQYSQEPWKRFGKTSILPLSLRPPQTGDHHHHFNPKVSQKK